MAFIYVIALLTRSAVAGVAGAVKATGRVAAGCQGVTVVRLCLTFVHVCTEGAVAGVSGGACAKKAPLRVGARCDWIAVVSSR